MVVYRLTRAHCEDIHCWLIPRGYDEAADTYLIATNVVSAFCAFSPNTFLKNRLATVMPFWTISSFVAALQMSSTFNRAWYPGEILHSPIVTDINQEVQDRTDAKTQHA